MPVAYPPGMPQHRKVPSPADAARIEKARDRVAAAEAELEAARAELVKTTVAAMKNGASHREAAKVAGVDERTTHRWGKANGWPTAEQKAERQAAIDRAEAFRRWLDAGQPQPRSEEP